jgi:hypothetical protein
MGLRTAHRVVLMLLAIGLPSIVDAQDSTRIRRDSARTILTAPPVALQVQSRSGPPMKPGRAFLSSFALPGYAQARFDRGSAGALFVAVELGALAMVKRSNDQVREARRFLADSLPLDFVVGTDGTLRPSAIASGGFTAELVRRRRLHLEDWLAVIAFNHLLSGADAFVAAQLWDLDAAVAVYPRSGGGGILVASFRW